METIKMMRGDSCIVFVSLTQDDIPITPGMVSDVEICIGDEIRKTYSGGTVGYDEEAGEWYFKPKQEETLGMTPGNHDVIARVKYPTSEEADVKGVFLGQVVMRDIRSGEVL